MNTFRIAMLGIAITVIVIGPLAADTYTSSEGKYKVKFPDKPKVSEKSTKSDLGELMVVVATYAVGDGSTYMVSYTDHPEAIAATDHEKVLDTIRDAVAKGGTVSNESMATLGKEKWPMREFTVMKDRQRIKCRVIIRDKRIYQVAVIGTTAFVDGRDAKAFMESLELID